LKESVEGKALNTNVMKYTTNSRKMPANKEDGATRKWLLAPIILAAVFIVTGILGSLAFGNPGQAQKMNLKLSSPDTSRMYMDYRNNWANYISVSTDASIHPDANGIKNVTLSVQNQTDKVIDEVKVKVDYITANGKTCQSEIVTLKAIAPNSALTVSAPASDKGICVKMQIESIQAVSFHFCYNRSMKVGSNPDPYFCN
jgi:hypothetical protein